MASKTLPQSVSPPQTPKEDFSKFVPVPKEAESDIEYELRRS